MSSVSICSLLTKRTSAVVAQEQSRRNTEHAYIFRSYDLVHNRATRSRRSSLNPGYADPYLEIWEAARATSAAPGYFRTIKINGLEYMDGAVGHNNRVLLAWNEGRQIGNSPEPHVAGVLSLGTGQKRPANRFGSSGIIRDVIGDLPGLARFAKYRVTETEEPHRSMKQIIADQASPKSFYHRFNVSPGMENIKLDDWELQKPRKRQNYSDRENPSSLNRAQTIQGMADRPGRTRFHRPTANRIWEST